MAGGWWVAYIDASRTLAPREWAALGEREGLWMVRPRSAERGPWCADVLLRSGAFALVVLDGAPVLSRETAVRLTRLARESDAAFLVLGDDAKASLLGGALRLRVARSAVGARSVGANIAPLDALGPLRGPAAASRGATLAPPSPSHGAKDGIPAPRTDARATPVLHLITPAASSAQDAYTGAGAAREGHGKRTARILVTIEKGGPYQTVSVGEVDRDIAVARRVRTHPEIPDRRGVARQQRQSPGVSARTNARSRRCAEAQLPDEPFLAAAVER